jgi:hypothetical protein
MAVARLVVFISHTHIRTEGRAPVWGSEFTTKADVLHGDSVELAAGLNITFVYLTEGLTVAPTEVKFEVLKSSFFVVAVFLWSSRVLVRINMHREATGTSTWPLGGGVKDEKIFFLSLMFYEKYFYLNTLLNSIKKALV